MSIEQRINYFNFQLDILKKELDLIDNTIGRLDEILLRNRNWGTTLWAGLIAIIVPLIKDDFYKSFLILASAVLPLLFWIIDIRWKIALLKCSDRQGAISRFLNSQDLWNSFKTNTITPLTLLDPTGENLIGKDRSKSYFLKAILYKDTSIFYPIQILGSLLLFLLTVLLWFLSQKFFCCFFLLLSN